MLLQLRIHLGKMPMRTVWHLLNRTAALGEPLALAAT